MPDTTETLANALKEALDERPTLLPTDQHLLHSFLDVLREIVEPVEKRFVQRFEIALEVWLKDNPDKRDDPGLICSFTNHNRWIFTQDVIRHCLSLRPLTEEEQSDLIYARLKHFFRVGKPSEEAGTAE